MAAAHRSDPGEILTLLDLVAEHEQAFTYDWRTRFGLPLEAVFDARMSWAESWALTMELTADPSSRVGAVLAGWSHPVSWDVMASMDLFDLTAKIASGRKSPKPYPRPWDPKPLRTSTNMPQAAIRAALAARGHGV